MDFLKGIIGSLTGQTDAGASPIGGILTSLLGGSGQQSGGMPDQNNGMGELLSGLRQAGLGDVVQSWIGNGPNQSVLPEQIQSAMGSEWVQQMARASGLVPEEFLSHLSQHLPNAVDAMTPNDQAREG